MVQRSVDHVDRDGIGHSFERVAARARRRGSSRIDPEIVRTPQDVDDNWPETDLEGRGKVPHDVERSAIIAARAKRKEASRYPERRWSQNRQIRSRPLASPQARHLVFCFLPLGCPPSSFSTGTDMARSRFTFAKLKSFGVVCFADVSEVWPSLP